jgi:hypothetical protein
MVDVQRNEKAIKLLYWDFHGGTEESYLTLRVDTALNVACMQGVPGSNSDLGVASRSECVLRSLFAL